MAPSPPHPSSLMLLLILAMALFVLPAYSTSRHALEHRPVQDGFRVSLKRIDSGGNFTKLERLKRAIKRGKYRLERLSAMAMTAASDEIQTPIYAGDGEFLIHLYIGTPPVYYVAILDTGSDLIWTQCKPCKRCFDQQTPIFDPKQSSSFSKLSCSSKLCNALPTSTCWNGCEYQYSYGDRSSTQGVMATETLTFGDHPKITISHIGFGCGDYNQGSGFTQAGGLMGLGRGPLSLISQLGSGKFSYCLGSMGDNTSSSSLLIGSVPNLNYRNGLVLSTPLIQNPSKPTFYYLSLEGITVGDTLLPVPTSTFALEEDGSGGMIIDSGTTITYLKESAYKEVKRAFSSLIELPVADGDNGLDLCFTSPSNSNVEIPKLIFHFKNADLELPSDNYMIKDSGLLCLTLGSSSGLSIFGNIQQQNMLVLHDLEKEVVSFIPQQCDLL